MSEGVFVISAGQKLLAAMNWDPDLNGLRVEGDKVLGLKCGLLPIEHNSQLQPGQVFFRLISASFIDELAAQGRHTVTVDVLNEEGRRLDGAVVLHGWPWNRWPAHDEAMQATVYGAELAQWGVYANYDPNRVEFGPYWVKVDGASDVFYGFGLPWNRHVCFTVVFQRMTWGAGTGGGAGGGNSDPLLTAIKSDTEAILAKLDQVFR